jgi:hypothetical protein
MISTNNNLKKPSKLKGQQLQQEIRLLERRKMHNGLRIKKKKAMMFLRLKRNQKSHKK